MAEDNLYLELLNSTKLVNIDEEEKEMLKMKLWLLLGKVTERYTMGDSSSVPIEIAEELLESICFSLKRELNTSESVIELLENDSLENLLKASQSHIEEDIRLGKSMLEEVIKTSVEIENISYNDTVMEIGSWINRYNYRFFAHKIDCSIDYQLSNPVSEELQGIEFVNEYLRRLLFENKFCNKFDKDKIIGILNSYCEDYNGLLINIFEPLITNVIGIDMLNDDVFKVGITANERKMLLSILKEMSLSEIKEKVIKSANNICNKLNICNEADYVKETALNLIIRIEEAVKNNNLENIFLSFKFKENKIKDIFIDNENMDDERLREVIDEIRSCRFTKDKIAIIHREIKSLDDLVQILNNCIWEDEVEELINNLSSDEIDLLKYYLNNKVNDNISNTGWEEKFKKVTRQL